MIIIPVLKLGEKNEITSHLTCKTAATNNYLKYAVVAWWGRARDGSRVAGGIFHSQTEMLEPWMSTFAVLNIAHF